MIKSLSRRSILKQAAASAAVMSTAGGSAMAINNKKTWGEKFLQDFSPADSVERNLKAGSNPIRLSCTAYCLHYSEGMDISARVKEIRAAGFTACEANDNWKKASDSEIRELKAALREHDLWFYTIHRCINNIHPDPVERRKINKQVAENVECAEKLGVKFIVSHTGSCAVSPTLPHRDNWTKETWDLSVAALKQILKDTSGSKVALGIEALNPCNINTPESHVRLKEDVGDDRIKVTLDPQNMLNMTTYYRTTELVNRCFELLKDDVCYAHCKDAKLKDTMLPAFEWVVVGTGGMDYENYLCHLSRMDRPMPFLLEFLPKEKYPEARKYITETAKKLGVTIYS